MIPSNIPSPNCGGVFDWADAKDRLAELNALAKDPNLWDDSDRAQNIMIERTRLADKMDAINQLESRLDDAVLLHEMAVEEGDDTSLREAEQQIDQLQSMAEKRELESLLSGQADDKDAYLEINAGAGGTEAQDWAEMLLRMYLRWAESHGYSAKMVDQSYGEEAGIKSVTIEVSGENAYGWLKTETGVHRLVRISPFDSSNRRHTSFASVSVTPVVEDDIDIDLDQSDIRVDTFRASGAGGQHVNKTDSAVRMTHGPSGIVVSCQNERSQHANREQAMKMLRAKLYEAEMQKRRQAANAVEAAKTDIGWGHQIRSYVLHPYQMVKDMRTEVETTQTDKVLDGEIDLFLEAALAHGVENSIENTTGDEDEG